MRTIKSGWLVVALAMLEAPALAGSPGGFPAGTWILDAAASKPLAATSQVLEIIADDGRSLTFSLHPTDADPTAKGLTWKGTYGSAPHPIEGSSILFGVAHGPHGSILISGRLGDGRPFHEKCHIAPSRRRLRCEGTVSGTDGSNTNYLEVYDLRR
jgi:hypothetical protein